MSVSCVPWSQQMTISYRPVDLNINAAAETALRPEQPQSNGIIPTKSQVKACSLADCFCDAAATQVTLLLPCQQGVPYVLLALGQSLPACRSRISQALRALESLGRELVHAAATLLVPLSCPWAFCTILTHGPPCQCAWLPIGLQLIGRKHQPCTYQPCPS